MSPYEQSHETSPFGSDPHSFFEDSVRDMIRYAGDDPDREGLRNTPARVRRAYAEMFSGYGYDVSKLFTTFDVGNYDELVLLKEIPFGSICEHHMLPFTGVAHVGYIPYLPLLKKGDETTRVVGISKLARLVEVYSRRLQIQERITWQVTKALDEYLSPMGSACVLEATHLCMSCRGVNKTATMVTSSLTGVFRTKPEARAEFFSLIGK